MLAFWGTCGHIPPKVKVKVETPLLLYLVCQQPSVGFNVFCSIFYLCRRLFYCLYQWCILYNFVVNGIFKIFYRRWRGYILPNSQTDRLTWNQDRLQLKRGQLRKILAYETQTQLGGGVNNHSPVILPQ